MRTPRTAWPASLRHVVTRAYLRLPWRTFFAVTANWTGSRVYDVLWTAFVSAGVGLRYYSPRFIDVAGTGVLVPGAYGVNSAFHG